MLTKIICSNCGREISKNNFQRHYSSCINKVEDNKYRLDHNDLFCKFCGCECKNKNSLVQHEIRCSKNPNRKSFSSLTDYIIKNIKGHTKDDNEVIAKQSKTMKDKYADGYIHPLSGKHLDIKYIYQQHNDEEINKWLKYVDTLNISIPEYETVLQTTTGYKYIKGSVHKINYSVKFTFEQDFIADLCLDGTLLHTNTVHHINKITTDNDIHNLLVFDTIDDHKRFHNSKYAYLSYNEITHKFHCEIRK